MTNTAMGAPGFGAIIAHVASWFSLAAYAFATSTVVFRATGQADYGIWATITAFRSMLLVLDAGLSMGTTRDASLAAAGDMQARGRWRASVALYVAGGAVTVLLAVVFADLPGALVKATERSSELRWVTILIGLETAAALGAAPVLAALRGTGRFDLLAATSVCTAAIGTLLLIGLTPSLGLVGAGIAVVIARLAGAVLGVVSLRTTRLMLGGIELGRRHLRRVIQFGLPLWAVAVGSAVGMATDVPIVGYMFGAEAAGAYGIGAVVPSVVAGFLFVLLDTAFPRLTTLARASFGHVVRLMGAVGMLAAGAAFGTLMLAADDVLNLWLGSAQSLTVAALDAYSLVWLLNIPAHVLVLGAIARDRHGVIGRVVLVEAAANVLLSVLFALLIGPIGPAIGTVLSVGISNGLVVPWLLGDRVGVAPLRLLFPCASLALTGVAVAAVARAVALPFSAPAIRVAVQGGLVSALIAGLGVAAISRRTLVQRWMGILFDGGWRVLQAERTERRAISPSLKQGPQIHIRAPLPLVTVRIATYNRGQLVADRAIASALAQTHSNIEVLVVGDHCDAATERAVTSVPDRRVRFENLPRRGAYPSDPMFRWMVAGSAPMNRALVLARGEWLAPLDDDDEFTPDHVEVLLEACRSRGLDLAYGVADMEVRPGEWEPVGSWPPQAGSIIHSSVLYSLKLREMEHSMEAWRLNEPGDWNLWRRMVAAGVRIGFVDLKVVRHYLEYREVLAEAVT